MKLKKPGGTAGSASLWIQVKKACRVTLASLLVMLPLSASGCGLDLSEGSRDAEETVIGAEASFVMPETAWSRRNQSKSVEEPVVFTEEGSEAEKAIGAKPRERSELPERGYAYRALPAVEQKVYEQILDCIQNQEERVQVDTLDKDVLDRAYEAVNADNGDLFWLNGYVYTTYSIAGQVTQLEFAPKYTMSYEDRLTMQRSIDASVRELLEGISAEASDYEKAKYVFEQLTTRVDYDLTAPENQNIISVFVYRRTVCQGYACATQYLLKQLGIESFVVSGIANGEKHAWNIAKLDGEYYCMDITWGNSQYSGQEADDTGKYVNYAYLNVTTEEMERTHKADSSFSLPTCRAVADNYFVKEGLYFYSWDPDAIGEVISRAWYGGPEPVSLKFSDAALQDQVIRYFVTEQHIVDYCPDMRNGYSYINDTTQHVLRISF